MPENTATLAKARRQSRNAAATSGWFELPSARIIWLIEISWRNNHNAATSTTTTDFRHSNDEPTVGDLRAGVVVIAHMEALCCILAEQTDVCGMRAITDRKRTAGALRVRQVFMGHASAEFNV